MLNCEFEGGKGGEAVLRSSLVTIAADGNVHLAYLTSDPGVLLELELRSSDDTLLVSSLLFLLSMIHAGLCPMYPVDLRTINKNISNLVHLALIVI